MVDEPADGGDAKRRALDAFRGALDASAPAGGMDRLRIAIEAERCGERRRRWLRKGVGTVLRAAAGLLLAAGLVILWRRSAMLGEVIICPHGTGARASEGLAGFLRNPDNFQRVCRCSPLYSGNLRDRSFGEGSSSSGGPR